ncbi:YeiH family protein [Hansschlegelia beijingensis]|uniref:Putative integral membrane protein (TIGR00698 family) n=1 Tax=Hansschlegelia beijingensis TaxID=1133344 RepID=A0A7W6D0E4_9HYPH|nr:YeiH family protein [Hansschlegelia beijingensis]MBB3971787.1 putative integral membrane protein (TIGR00698 family) [Hansschlegelia beijingensis]
MTTNYHAAELPQPASVWVTAAQAGGRLLPGLALAFGIAGLAYATRWATGFTALSPMILAIVIGMAARNMFGMPALAGPGVAFSLRRILRLAIILLGLQLTFGQVAEVGVSGLAVIAATLGATFIFTVWLGRLLGVEARLAQLIAAGTSICGASAVIAANTVTRGSDEDVAYAVACVTVFGSIAMFLYPWLPGLLHLDPQAYGLWSGASIHEIAQVVAAAFQNGQDSGEFGTIAKLSRVILLAPAVLALSFFAARRGEGGGGAPMPWFVLGFLALAALNSVFVIPAEAKAAVATATGFLLSAALAAMGLSADLRKLRAMGLRPLLLGLASFLFIAGFSLVLVKLAA